MRSLFVESEQSGKYSNCKTQKEKKGSERGSIHKLFAFKRDERNGENKRDKVMAHNHDERWMNTSCIKYTKRLDICNQSHFECGQLRPIFRLRLHLAAAATFISSTSFIRKLVLVDWFSLMLLLVSYFDFISRICPFRSIYVMRLKIVRIRSDDNNGRTGSMSICQLTAWMA